MASDVRRRRGSGLGPTVVGLAVVGRAVVGLTVVGLTVVGLLPAGCGGGGVDTHVAEPEAPGVPSSRAGGDRVGRPAPEWGPLAWVGAPPRTLAELRGQVVLVRFFTDTCPFCRATAPALAELDEEYRARGVTVVGMYHPKPRGTPRTPEQVEAVVKGWGWRFGVALDLDWAVLDAYWLAQGDRDYTSVSFVVDREGVVRFVHPGPEFHDGGPADHEQCRQDYRDVRAALDALLAEPVASG